MAENSGSPKEQEPEGPKEQDHSLGKLIGELSGQISKLVRQEIALARAEMAEKTGAIGKTAGLMAAAAFLGVLAILVLSACIVLAIAVALPGWLAALIVGVAYLLIAGILAAVGVRRAKRAKAPVPTQTIETVKEDLSWARHPTRSVER